MYLLTLALPTGHNIFLYHIWEWFSIELGSRSSSINDSKANSKLLELHCIGLNASRKIRMFEGSELMQSKLYPPNYVFVGNPDKNIMKLSYDCLWYLV